MWFKNLIFYRFTKAIEWNSEQLEEKLSEKRFRGCNSQDISSYGWVPPLGRHGDMLTHTSGDFVMVCAKKEEKILPASVIKDALEEKIETIEQQEQREVFSKEKKALKDDVTMELLPRAFTKHQKTLAYLDTKEGWLIVDASSFKKAEELTSCLRECLGSLPVINPPLKNPPSASMTQWLSENPSVPTPFILGDECDLREPGDEGGQINVRRQALITEEIQAHLEGGMLVSKLALQWDEAQTFVLSDDLTVRKLKFTEVVQDQLDEVEAETAAEQFDADFAVMSLSVRKLINDLVEALGGLTDISTES